PGPTRPRGTSPRGSSSTTSRSTDRTIEPLWTMFARLPVVPVRAPRQIERLVFQGGRHRVVPPVQEPEQADDREDLHDLSVVPMAAELFEVLRPDLVRNERRVAREPECRALSLVVQR